MTNDTIDSTTPWANQPYSIKRYGTTITNCDSEPVQTPGCIQAHGAMLVLRLGDLTILQASENSAHYFGEPPERLLGQAIASVVGDANETRLREMLEQELLKSNSLFAFTLPTGKESLVLDVCVHIAEDVLVLEFETSPSLSDSDSDFFVLVKSAVNRLQTNKGLITFCQSVAEEVRAITGLDRVMIYRFHADHHGEVVAESKRDDLHAFLGLHYPEGDIPTPTREIFKRIGIRPLPNAAGPLVEMVPLTNPDTGRPLNMTHCSLRGASVMYTEYLANMGVAASLTMPILVDGELWGLIACHHLTPTSFPHQVRAVCELLAQVASLQLKSAEQNEQLIYRLKLNGIHQQLVAKAAQEGGLIALIEHQSPSLLDAMAATGTALYHQDRWWCSGVTPSEEQLDALGEWLNQRPEFESVTQPVFITNSLALDYPAGAEIANIASGVLAIRVSRLQKNLIIWFRPEIIQTVNWAGNPDEKPLVPGPHGSRLTPRGSFELFVESVREHSLPWSPMEIDSALQLRLLVMELVIFSAERLADLNANLSRSNEELDAFAYVASHDLKEPLRGINRYAHKLLEGAKNLDEENRKCVENLMRLTVRMDSLLDSLLHFSRVGRTRLEFELIDFNGVIEEALEMIGARREESACTIEIPRPLPTALCDPVRVREIYSNLISNALKYNCQACPRVELGYLAPDELGARPNAPPEATGNTIYYVRDNGIGIEARHFEQIFRMFKRLHGSDEYNGGVGAGLTIVQKLVQRHGGSIWLDSTIGVGSTFFFTLPCNGDLQP